MEGVSHTPQSGRSDLDSSATALARQEATAPAPATAAAAAAAAADSAVTLPCSTFNRPMFTVSQYSCMQLH